MKIRLNNRNVTVDLEQVSGNLESDIALYKEDVVSILF
jgi:hypothetical protein